MASFTSGPDQLTPAPAPTHVPSEPLLSASGVRVEYATAAGSAVAVDGISFTLDAGGSLAILGESGSGKTSLGLALMGLVDGPGTRVSGSVLLDGRDMGSLTPAELEDMRGARMAMIFQDPLSSLNPVKRVGDQIGELFSRHRRLPGDQAVAAAIEVMRRVRIPDAARRASDYPHQFSGGMRQRVMIAMAIALDPRVIIADEPTTALDVTVQAQVVELLLELRQGTGSGLIVISHDLGLAAALAQDVLVMYAGRVAERGPIRACYERPAHPYTRGLIDSAPRSSASGERLNVIPGSPPRLDQLPAGCAFHPRCPIAQDICGEVEPPVRTILPGREVACHFAERMLEAPA